MAIQQPVSKKRQKSSQTPAAINILKLSDIAKILNFGDLRK